MLLWELNEKAVIVTTYSLIQQNGIWEGLKVARMSHEDGHWGRALQAEGRVKITAGMEVRAEGGMEDDIREAWEEAVQGWVDAWKSYTFYWAAMGRFWAGNYV